MADWYSRAREEDGRTDDEVAAEIRLRRDAAEGERMRPSESAAPEPLYLDGGGDPDFDQIDRFLQAHFNARAIYTSDLLAMRDKLDQMAAAVRLLQENWPKTIPAPMDRAAIKEP